MTVTFHEDALADFQDAIRYYSEISWKLVSEFEAEFHDFTARIRANPQSFHLTPGGAFRRANLEQFPFRILYQTLEDRDEVRVLVICHNKRHPSYGLKRR